MRFSCGVKPADLLAASMAAELIFSTYLCETWMEHLLIYRPTLYQLSYASPAKMYLMIVLHKTARIIINPRIQLATHWIVVNPGKKDMIFYKQHHQA